MDTTENESSQRDFQSEQGPSFQESYDALSIPRENLNILFSPKPNSNYEAFLALKEQADHGLVDAQFEIGCFYADGEHIQQSYKSAFNYYKLAADQGHRSAQLHLATLYDEGLGVKQDSAQAFYYYKLAAEQKSPGALAQLGKFYDEGKGGVEKSSQEAIRYYQMAADLGSPIAWNYLAEAYESGVGVEKSKEKARYYKQKRFQHTKEEADEGDAGSQTAVGWLFENGKGVKKSIESAVHYYQLSADQNFLRGLFLLAECYATGKGVEKSSEKAIHYYKLSADQGYPLAQYSLAQYLLRNKINEEKAVHYLKLVVQTGQCESALLAMCEYDLGKCFEKGTGIKKSVQNALYYYRIASEHGDDSAQNRLGNAYLEGELGLKKSPEKAIEYYQLASQQGCSSSLEKIGECYERGEGVEQSSEKAFHYYKLAAEIDIKKGYGDSIYALARCYELGIGTEKSLENAIHYYRLAAENGFKIGYYKVVSCYKEIGGKENAKKNRLAWIKLGDYSSSHEVKDDNKDESLKRIKVCKIELQRSKVNQKIVKSGANKPVVKKMFGVHHILSQVGKTILHTQLASGAIAYPGVKYLDMSQYIEDPRAEVLRNIFKQARDSAICLDADHLNETEIQLVRDAMIENPRFTFICQETDVQHLYHSFEEIGYHPQTCLRCAKFKDKDVYGLLFMGEAA